MNSSAWYLILMSLLWFYTSALRDVLIIYYHKHIFMHLLIAPFNHISFKHSWRYFIWFHIYDRIVYTIFQHICALSEYDEIKTTSHILVIINCDSNVSYFFYHIFSYCCYHEFDFHMESAMLLVQVSVTQCFTIKVTYSLKYSSFTFQHSLSWFRRCY